MFLNYILYHRINTEEILPCRSIFDEDLKRADPGKKYGRGCDRGSTTGVQKKQPTIRPMHEPLPPSIFIAAETAVVERNPPLPSALFGVQAFRPVRFMHRSGLIVMTIMPG